MLFGYPIEATAENWFHECLVEILETIHANPQQNFIWPDIIPLQYRERLSGRTGLRARLIAYQEAISSLGSNELNQVSNALIEQNEIADLLACRCNCETLDELPLAIQQPLKSLFEFGFKILTDLGIRDQHYQVIYNTTAIHVCPFCGCEYFDAPGAPREALDHYLAESKYTFAATNLKNLAPMGNKCNSKYKLAQNILYDDNGTRRRSYYPYDQPGRVQISLDRSEPFAGTQKLFPLPHWEIDFNPTTEEILTWNSVFRIDERYKRDILDADFMNWLREFSAWCRSGNLRLDSEQDVINALDRYAGFMQAMGFRDRAFLKTAVFQMLRQHCENGNGRLITLIQGVVVGGMA